MLSTGWKTSGGPSVLRLIRISVDFMEMIRQATRIIVLKMESAVQQKSATIPVSLLPVKKPTGPLCWIGKETKGNLSIFALTVPIRAIFLACHLQKLYYSSLVHARNSTSIQFDCLGL